MKPTIEPDDVADDLTAAYRRASANSGSRPNAATRAAILAEARRVAAGSSAANDPWWNWKAAASVAVIGLVGMLAVRTFRSEPVVPLQAPVPTAATVPVAAQTAPPTPNNASATATSIVADKAANSAAAPNDVRREQASALRDDSASELVAPSAPPVPAISAAAPERGKSVIGAVQSTADASGAASVIASDRAIMRRTAPAAATLELMEHYFPGAFGSANADQRPWILFDQLGAVLRTGTADSNRTSKLEPYLEQRFPGIKIGAGAVGSVQNNKGQSADYAFFWLAADSRPLAATP